jgi:hypothetical protein
MVTTPQARMLHWLSILPMVFGILGGIFFWWVPLGLVLSLAGLLGGFVDWSSARRHSADHSIAVAAMVIALFAFVFDLTIALLGLQTITFGGP